MDVCFLKSHHFGIERQKGGKRRPTSKKPEKQEKRTGKVRNKINDEDGDCDDAVVRWQRALLLRNLSFSFRTGNYIIVRFLECSFCVRVFKTILYLLYLAASEMR